MNKEAINDGNKYTSTLRLANPNSQLDVQIIGDCAVNKIEGTTSAGVALKYFMSRDRQMKTLAGFRTDFNSLRKEISLKVSDGVIRIYGVERESEKWLK
jgi:hypothetical protein